MQAINHSNRRGACTTAPREYKHIQPAFQAAVAAWNEIGDSNASEAAARHYLETASLGAYRAAVVAWAVTFTPLAARGLIGGEHGRLIHGV